MQTPNKTKKKAPPKSEIQIELKKFYQEILEPRFEKQSQELRQHTAKLILEFRQEITQEISEFRQEFNDFKNETYSRFDDLYKKIEDLHQEYIVIREQLKRFDKLFDDQARMRAELSQFRVQVQGLQNRIDEIEARLNKH